MTFFNFKMFPSKAKPKRSKMFRTESQIAFGRKKEEITANKPSSFGYEATRTVQITCKENFNQYLVNTTLHGLRYVGDRSISPFERFDVILVLHFQRFHRDLWIILYLK